MSEFIDIIRNINGKGKLLDPEFIEKHYAPYGINVLYGRSLDSLDAAEFMNRNPEMSKWEQYQLYYHRLSKNTRRFGARVNVTKPKYVELVMEYYGFSREKARVALTILTTEELQHIKEFLDEGGVQNE